MLENSTAPEIETDTETASSQVCSGAGTNQPCQSMSYEASYAAVANKHSDRWCSLCNLATEMFRTLSKSVCPRWFLTRCLCAVLILKSLGCFFSHFLTFLDPLNVFCHRNRESDGNRVKDRCSQRGLCGICHEGCRSMWTLPISPYPDKHRTLRRPVLYFNTLLCVNRGVRFQSKIAQKNLKKPLDTF
jgi:hypothetical protein